MASPKQSGEPRPVAIVAHTHWDREWYAPFETFQRRLAATVDAILDVLEGDSRWTSFLLDGQVAAVDDYLDLRPAGRERLARLVRAGRLSIGPWYVLMDEFCVSGETILRNLQLGIARAGHFGQSAFVGYLPDMFGHVAQMPQILRQAGIADAVVWRGVPAAIERTAFQWKAPDGSEVRAEYLPAGYANGAFLPDGVADLIRRVRALESESESFLGRPDTALLIMNGTDHQSIQPRLPSLVSEANRVQSRYRFRIESLAGYIASSPADDLATWEGELRSGARSPILMGVVSNRADVKDSAGRAETALERLAEPLAALWLRPADWPEDALDRAWLEMIRNSAHDSICACSADEVGRAVLHRYDTAAAAAAAVVSDVADLAALATSHPGPLILNPSARARSGPVELILPGGTSPGGAQTLRDSPGGTEVRVGVGADLGRLLGELAGDGWLGDTARCTEASVSERDGCVDLDLVYDPTARPSPSAAPVVAEAWALAGARRDSPLKVRVERRPSQTVVARVTVPGYGWSGWDPSRLDVPPVRVSPAGLDNDLVSLRVDPSSATFAVGGVAGLGRLVDGGDAGDTYNYCPPRSDSIVDTPAAVDIEVVESGPVRGWLRVHAHYVWPASLDEDGGVRVGRRDVHISTDLVLVAGEAVLRATTTFDNPSRDHRLRAWFPLPRPAAFSEAGCAFATVRRSGAEGGPREPALPTFPARRFVSAGGLTVATEGLMEYELAQTPGGGSALAITVLRSTGILSRPALVTRPNVAGPPLRLSDAQMLGRRTFSYAVAIGEVDGWDLADDVFTPFVAVGHCTGEGSLGPRGSRLEVAGAEVSSLRRHDGRLELRLFNPTAEPALVTLPGQAGAQVDLRGTVTGRWDGSFELGPWAIATVVLDRADLDA